MTDIMLTLNHPWSIYLREPISSYTKYKIYYAELLRLLNFTQKLNTNIQNLGENQIQLTNFIIGTPMEDALHKKNCSNVYIFQWQQLFPYHITKFINYYTKLKKDIIVEIVVISPDDIFMDDNYKEPLFMTYCVDYKFEKVKNREYVYSGENLTIKINIFTCPFPQLEQNKTYIMQSNRLIKVIGTYDLDCFAPSPDDIIFIEIFYEQLEAIASNPLSNMIINSYVTFRNVREYDNYGLFKSLLQLANKHKLIATEWRFSEDNHFTRIVSKINFTIDYLKYAVSYVNPDNYALTMEKYEKISPLKIKKNLSDIATGKLTLCILIKFPYNKLVLRKITYIH